jgi:GWxTD domain-containing protein
MIEALSAALFHFLWQGVALTLIPASALLSRSPRVRYAAACVALFAMPVAFAVTFAISIPPAGSHAAIPVELHAAPAASAPAAPVSLPFDLENSMRWFVPFWAVGVALFYLRTFVAWIAVQRLRRSSSVAAPEFWRQRLQELSQRLGIRRVVALLSSELVDVPVVAGFLRPVIFVPAALFTGMPVEQLEYLLIHELAHIRRFDYAVNLLQKAVEGLLFYHPAVWWVSRILRTERENCCDDAVVELRGNAREYATVLATLERHRNAPALAASGGHLGKRIMRLLNRPHPSHAAPVLGLLGLAITATMAWAALQQPAPKPAAPPLKKTLNAQVANIVEAELAAAVPQETPLEGAYRKWVNEDVAYIIEDSERKAFKALTTDEERAHFIEQFWARRDPTPGTPENEMKVEHYRRIAYANQRFAGTIDGWKTDRGRIYITYGPPTRSIHTPAHRRRGSSGSTAGSKASEITS